MRDQRSQCCENQAEDNYYFFAMAKTRAEWVRLTMRRIEEVVEDDRGLKRFVVSIEEEARENGLAWPEVSRMTWDTLKSILGGGAGSGQFATGLKRLSEDETADLIATGGYRCSCTKVFAYQEHMESHEKRHRRDLEREERKGKRIEVVELDVEEDNDGGKKEEKMQEDEVTKTVEKCPTCSTEVLTKEMMIIHVGEVHMEQELADQLIKIFPDSLTGSMCDKCGKIFDESEYEKREHILLTHPWVGLTESILMSKDSADLPAKEDNEVEIVFDHTETKGEEKKGEEEDNEVEFICPSVRKCSSQHQNGFEGVEMDKEEEDDKDDKEDEEEDKEDDEEDDKEEMEDEEDNAPLTKKEVGEEQMEVDNVEEGHNNDEARMEEGNDDEEEMKELQRMIDEGIWSTIDAAQSTATSTSTKGKIVKKQSPRECDLCDIVFKNGKAAGNHRRNEHDGSQFKCKECGKGFSRKQGLVEHKRGIHEKVDYSCGKCGKKYGFKSSLIRHETDGACRRKEKARAEYAGSVYLPQGWTFRGKKRGLDVRCPEGFKFESYLAIGFFMKQEGYTEEQIARMFRFPNGKNHKRYEI